jgi:hypothetical protein
MEVLSFLSERTGGVVAKRDLVDAVWPGGFVADNTVTHAIQELRAALGDEAASPRYIETVHRRGYRLIPSVEEDCDVDCRGIFMHARFLLVGKSCEVFLADGENVIGRACDAQVFVDSPSVSRHHARITVAGGGAIVEDLGSKNGTRIGSTRITEPTPVLVGDVLQVGSLSFEFRGREAEDMATQSLASV